MSLRCVNHDQKVRDCDYVELYSSPRGACARNRCKPTGSSAGHGVCGCVSSAWHTPSVPDAELRRRQPLGWYRGGRGLPSQRAASSAVSSALSAA
jgi:hypothetical protein